LFAGICFWDFRRLLDTLRCLLVLYYTGSSWAGLQVRIPLQFAVLSAPCFSRC
jgi:hypothetical protein